MMLLLAGLAALSHSAVLLQEQDTTNEPVSRPFYVNSVPDPTSCPAGTEYLGFGWNLCVDPVACS